MRLVLRRPMAQMRTVVLILVFGLLFIFIWVAVCIFALLVATIVTVAINSNAIIMTSNRSVVVAFFFVVSAAITTSIDTTGIAIFTRNGARRRLTRARRQWHRHTHQLERATASTITSRSRPGGGGWWLLLTLLLPRRGIAHSAVVATNRFRHESRAHCFCSCRHDEGSGRANNARRWKTTAEIRRLRAWPGRNLACTTEQNT